MKKTISVLLLISILTAQTVSANDFFCKEIYDKKIARLEKSSNIREIGRVALFSVVGIAGAGLAFTGIGLTTTGLLFFGGFFGIPAGVMIDFSVPRREDDFRAAYEVQSLLRRSYGDLVAEAMRNRDESLRQALAKFDAQVSHPDYLETLARKVNQERMSAGLPFLSAPEVIAVMKENIRATILNGKIEISNSISDSLAKLKRKKWVSSELSYDAFRQQLIDSEAYFCPNGKALRLKTVLRDLYRPGDYPVRTLPANSP